MSRRPGIVFVALLGVVLTAPADAGVHCPSHVTLRIDLLGGKPTTTGGSCVRHGGSVTVVVDHVNPFLHDVEIDGQVFRSNFELPPATEALALPALPRSGGGDAFDGAVSSYALAARELYLAAGQLERRLRAVLYGTPTPDRDRLLADVTAVLSPWVEVGDGTPTEVSGRILRAGHEGLRHVENLRRSALEMRPEHPDTAQEAALERLETSFEAIVADRDSIVRAFTAASDLVLQLGRARFEIASAPIPARGEALPVRLSVTLRDGLDAGRYPVAFEMLDREVARLKVAGGYTVGASAGVTFSSPVDAVYGTVPDGAGNEVVERKPENEDEFSAGLAVMLNVHQRKLGDVNHGIALGLGVRDGGGLQLSLGYGVLLGRSRRVIISAGGIGSEVERIAGGLQTGDILQPGETIRTEDKIKLGFYVGATFKFWPPGRRR